jgi:uncharacterized membrane protein
VTAAAARWSPTEAFKFAFEKIKAEPVGILLPLVVAGLVTGGGSIFNQLGGPPVDQRGRVDGTGVLFVSLGSVITFLLSSFMAGGVNRFLLKVHRGQPYEFGDIFKGGDLFGGMLVANLLIALGVGFGMMLCIVPGVILALGLAFTQLLIADRKLPAIDALKESWRLTTGQKGSLAVFFLLAVGVIILGLCACFIGVLVAGPIVQLALAYVYLVTIGEPPAAPVPRTLAS